MHWVWHIIIGAILLGGGVGVTSLGWHCINQWNQVGFYLPTKKDNRKKCFHLIYVLLGLLSIIVGGPWTTYGWNQHDNHLKKQALIQAVIHEWSINNLRLNRPPLVGKVYEIENGQKMGVKIFPVLNTIAVESYLASGTIDFSKSDDLKFFVTLSNYNRFIREVNYIFKIFNDDVIHITGEDNEDKIEKQIARTEYYQNDIRISPIVQSLFKCHQELTDILKSKYKKILEEQFSKRPKETEQKQ